MVADLPEEVGQGNGDDESDGDGEPSAGEQAALRGEQECDESGDEKEDDGVLVFEAEASADAKDDPPGAADTVGVGKRVGLGDTDEGEGAEHPENGVEGVHRQIAVDAEVNAGNGDAKHGQGSCGAAASEGPDESSGEEDFGGSGESGEQTQGSHVPIAEKDVGEAGLEGDHGGLVDIAEGDMAAADEVVQLVAEDAVAGMLGEDGADGLNGQLDGGEDEADPEEAAEAIALDGRGGGRGERAHVRGSRRWRGWHRIRPERRGSSMRAAATSHRLREGRAVEAVFEDRRAAGRALARVVGETLGPVLRAEDALVLALPRGGVPVGLEVARALRLPLDVCVVRKLGVPGQEELAMGAVASGGIVVVQPEVVRAYRIEPETIEAVAARERLEIERREAAYRQGRMPPRLNGRLVILVDDGLATGSTMRAAVRALRPVAGRLVVAVPVGAASTCEALRREADGVICLESSERFRAVGEFYRAFEQMTDDEVRALLAEASEIRPEAAGRKDLTGR